MGVKKRNSFQLNWQAATPVPFNPNTPLTGTLTGAMASTNTIYTNIQDASNFDNIGFEFTWTGTPTGTITVWVSESGGNSGGGFYQWTLSPALTQPAGSASGSQSSINQLPFRYFYVRYVNASGSGALTAFVGSKDIN